MNRHEPPDVWANVRMYVYAGIYVLCMIVLTYQQMTGIGQ